MENKNVNLDDNNNLETEKLEVNSTPDTSKADQILAKIRNMQKDSTSKETELLETKETLEAETPIEKEVVAEITKAEEEKTPVQEKVVAEITETEVEKTPVEEKVVAEVEETEIVKTENIVEEEKILKAEAELEEEIVIEDYSEYNVEKLLEKVKETFEKENILKSFNKIKAIKDEFLWKVNKQKEELKSKFIADGNDEKAYEYTKTPVETDFFDILDKYFEKRNLLKEKEAEQNKENLKLKYEVIEGFKNLINKPESFEITFNNFKTLQKRWQEIGLVPKDAVKQLWDDYHREVDNFYKYLEINKQLRELDLKKNLEKKIQLCEQAEELLAESNILSARKHLQTLHERWKEAGPVLMAKKDEIWDRFKAATITINNKFQENFEKIKEQQEKNLESKTFLCEKAEEYSQEEHTTHKEWKDASNRVLRLQSLWKNIGFVPQNQNTEIYQRFRAACDVFFGKNRDFYSKINEERDNNMRLKEDLCMQVESLQESTEWKKTTDLYKNLQAEWKKIGPVSQKHSEQIWQRFRKACNIFFDRKKEHFSSKKQDEANNLIAKREIIEKIKAFEPTSKPEDIETLKQFQKSWTEIGFVPFDDKDTIYAEYREAVSEKFDKLNIDKSKLDEINFNDKISSLRNSKNSKDLFSNEISKIQNKIDKIEGDAKLLENNIGFFANSKNAESMISGFSKKIENSKKEVAKLKEQIKKILKEA